MAIATRRAEQKREEAKVWSADRRRGELGYLERARANRERAMATRQAARASVAEALATRKRAATKERANNYLVTEEKARILKNNRVEAATIYRARYATRTAAAEFNSSPWKALQQALMPRSREHSSVTQVEL